MSVLEEAGQRSPFRNRSPIPGGRTTPCRWRSAPPKGRGPARMNAPQPASGPRPTGGRGRPQTGESSPLRSRRVQINSIDPPHQPTSPLNALLPLAVKRLVVLGYSFMVRHTRNLG